MSKIQEKFINDSISSYNPCILTPKYTDQIDTLVPKTIGKILTSLNTTGSDMKAILCLFDTLLLSNGNSIVSTKIQRWVTNMHKLPINSSEGYVYITDIFSRKAQVVVKAPQYIDGYASLIREYFIGLRALNKLRYTIPTVVYTLGLFKCNSPSSNGKINREDMCSNSSTPFVIYEKIPGDSVKHLLESNEITWENWLVCFAQILLSLELAQRECNFTHFDLHAGNVMLRNDEEVNYTLPLDGTTYTISGTKILPVIIDFGMSTAEVDGVTVGSHDFAIHGMMPYMVQGYDMYKFLIYSATFAKYTSIGPQIIDIFRFYGNNDPYNIYTKKLPGLKTVTHEYCSMASYSAVATDTPLSLFQWLYTEYKSILSPYITITPRDIYIPLHYSSTIQMYDDLFHHQESGRAKAISLAESCVNTTPSYIISHYNIMVLNNYNKSYKSPIIDTKINSLQQALDLYKYIYIAIDIARLYKVTKINLPRQKEIIEITRKVLNITIKNASNFDKKIEDELADVTDYQKKLEVYVQFYYTIRELKQDAVFESWIGTFKPILKFYMDNVGIVTQTLRWKITLNKAY